VTSEPKTARKVRKPVEPGSKRWYREMLLERLGIWFLPLWTAYLTARHVDWSWGPALIAAVVSHWVVVTLAFLMVIHAVWRVDVNVEGNSQNPFTEKDHKVLGRALLFTALGGLFVVLFPIVLLVVEFTESQREAIDISSGSAFIALIAVLAVGGSFHATHKKAMCAWRQLKEARAELEEGV
jgi:membrane protein YdbS with pleckstrin-like domain